MYNLSYPFPLDLAAFATPTNCSISISGTVYNDPDGGNIDGTGINNPNGVQLYAYLVSGSGTACVVQTVAVNPDGTYSFTGNFAPNTYSVYLSTQSSLSPGSVTMPDVTLPTSSGFSWIHTAEGQTAAGDGSTNGIINSVVVGSTDNISNVNFAIQPPVVFPVVLSHFKGVLENEKSLLFWETQMELNLSHFEVEYSTDALLFESIGSVEATAVSGYDQQYRFIHHTPLPGNNYYRIKMIDTDGSFEYSSVVVLRINISNELYLYPNPSVLTSTLEHPVSAGKTTISIRDVKGQVVKTYSVDENVSRTLLEVKGLEKGIYMVTWDDGETQLNHKWVIY